MVGITSEEQNKVKRMKRTENSLRDLWKRTENSLRDLWNNIKCTNIQIIGVPEEVEKEMATHSNILPGESQGQRTQAGCRLWGCTESDMTEAT